MRKNDVVMVNQDVEVSPLNFIKRGTLGKVEDFTVPDYVCIQFVDGGYAWMNKKYVTVIKTGY